jgi:hypothetical protein
MGEEDGARGKALMCRVVLPATMVNNCKWLRGGDMIAIFSFYLCAQFFLPESGDGLTLFQPMASLPWTAVDVREGAKQRRRIPRKAYVEAGRVSPARTGIS